MRTFGGKPSYRCDLVDTAALVLGDRLPRNGGSRMPVLWYAGLLRALIRKWAFKKPRQGKDRRKVFLVRETIGVRLISVRNLRFEAVEPFFFRSAH